MRNKIKIIFITSLFMLAFLAPARADIDITVTTEGDVDLNVSTNGDGAMLSVDYNGRDLLNEIEQQIKTIENLRTVIVYYAAKNDVEDLQNEIEELDAELEKLVGELNHVFNDLYAKVNSQAHVIGINPGNSTVAVTLIAGNKTVADFIQENIDDIRLIDARSYLIAHRLKVLDDDIGNELRSIESTLQTLEENLNNTAIKTWTLDIEVEDLTKELATLKARLETTQDSILYITLMFGVFSVIAIAIVATAKRP